jgi:hypothetical protein
MLQGSDGEEAPMQWEEFAVQEPRLAGDGLRHLAEPGVVLVATIRSDGTARLSPVEPLFWNGNLYLSMLWRSRKAQDLLRDPRILVHSIVTSRNGTAGEYKLRGRAVAETDAAVQVGYAAAVRERVGWDPEPGRFHLFWVDVQDVTVIRYDEPSGDQFVTRWPDGLEFLRRATSATSLGERTPYRDLLADPPVR